MVFFALVVLVLILNWLSAGIIVFIPLKLFTLVEPYFWYGVILTIIVLLSWSFGESHED